MHKVYCAYTPSNGAMALLNKISVFRILSLLSSGFGSSVVKVVTVVLSVAYWHVDLQGQIVRICIGLKS